MGANGSKNPAEEIYAAACSNDGTKLGRVLQSLHAAHRITPELFRHCDSDGRTALHMAVLKNHHAAARLLLQYGADVHYVNAKLYTSGNTPLHDATRKQHEAMCELLMHYGASPFISNTAGRTCMDEAVAEGGANLLRRFEQSAIWRGTVAVKTSKLGGLSQPYKSRYLVMVPYIQLAAAPGQTPPAPRTQLWIYRDANANVPKSRLWLDGATTVRMTPNDMILRLHTSHKPPAGDLSFRYDRGYCLSLRIADGTTTAAAALNQLESLINGNTAAAAAAGNQQAYYPAIPSLGSFSSSITGGTSSYTHSHTNSYTNSYTATPAGSGGGGGGTYTPPRLSSSTRPSPDPSTPPPAANMAYGSSTGMPVNDTFVDTLRALPGESDSDFARRLASAITIQTGQEQPTHFTRTSSGRPTSRLQPSPGSAPQPATTTTSPQDIWGGIPLPTGQRPVSPRVVSVTPASDRTVTETPSAPPLATMPSGPAAPLATMGSGSTAADPSEEQLCVICLSARREAGYLHGSSLHLCVCRDCCSHVSVGGPCPLCRQPVERVINVFNS